jgi:hypothetical protein
MRRLNVHIPAADGRSHGTLHVPDGDGPWPGVLVFPDIYYRAGQRAPFDAATEADARHRDALRQLYQAHLQ